MQIKRLAARSTAPVFNYLYHHPGSVSLVDFQVLPQWKILAKVSQITTSWTRALKFR